MFNCLLLEEKFRIENVYTTDFLLDVAPSNLYFLSYVNTVWSYKRLVSVVF